MFIDRCIFEVVMISYDEILQYCQQIKNQYEEVKYAMPEMITETTVN